MKMEFFPGAEELHVERPRQEKTGIYDTFATENRQLFSKFERSRIAMSDGDFAPLYKDFNRDKETAERLFQQNSAEESEGDYLGHITEVLTYQSIVERGSLGKEIKAKPLSLHDDYFNHSDLGIYARGGREPIVGGIDVTSNVNMETGQDGLHKKMERIARHIEWLASLDPDKVNEFKVWYNAGGMSTNPNRDNIKQKEFENLFNKVSVLKYYKTSEEEGDPNRPMAIFGAPQIVLGFDNAIINGIIAGNERDRRTMPGYLDMLTILETRLCIEAISKFLKRAGNRNNYIYETYQIATDSWLDRMSTTEFAALYERARKEIVGNSDTPEIVKKQIQYYIATLQEVFTRRKISGQEPKGIIMQPENAVKDSGDYLIVKKEPKESQNRPKRDRPVLTVKRASTE